MNPIDAWHFPRPELAQTYLDLFMTGPGGPLTLFSPRRTGKTWFLLNDLGPAAERRKFFVLYVDLWQDRVDPTQALIAALDEAIDQITVPKSKLRSRLATTVKRVSAMGASVDFGEEPVRKRPASPYLQVDFLLKEIVRLAKRPVLLMLDEIQQLGSAKDGEVIVSALRSTLTKLHGKVFALFTGSSERKLRELFARVKAPLYEFSSHVVFPLLGDDFVHFIAEKHRASTKRKLDEKLLRTAFRALDQRPKPFVDMVLDMIKQNSTDVAKFASLHASSREDFAVWWNGLRPLEQLVLWRIAAGAPVSSKEALESYAETLGVSQVSPGSIYHALNKLRHNHLIASSGERGNHAIESSRFATWIRNLGDPN